MELTVVIFKDGTCSSFEDDSLISKLDFKNIVGIYSLNNCVNLIYLFEAIQKEELENN